MTKNASLLLAAAAAALLAGCATPPADMAEANIDPRQGEEVNNICFAQQIRNWRELDNRSVIVEANSRDEYKLDLIGTCNPRDAFLSIGLVSRGGSSCLSSGDQLITDERYNGGSCSIRRIYKWNKDAVSAQAAAAAS
jgi:putative hemolysin